MLHRVRESLVRQRARLATALRAHLAEVEIMAPQGIHHRVEKLAAEVHNPAVPQLAREVLIRELHQASGHEMGRKKGRIGEHTRLKSCENGGI